MAEHDREMTLSDGRDVLVVYEVEDYGSEPSGMYGPPEDYDPGSGPELYVTKVLLSPPKPEDPQLMHAWLNSEPPFDEDALKIDVSDVERERLEGVIAKNSDWWMPDCYDEDY